MIKIPIFVDKTSKTLEELEELIKKWENLSERLDRHCRNAPDGPFADRYLGESGVYAVCADQLKRILREAQNEG